MKYLHIYIMTLALTVGAACYTVVAQSTNDNNGFTSTASVEDKPVNSGMTALGAGLIGLGVLILGVGIYYMVRNRRSVTGGIQRQDKDIPTPPTTDSINNPGSGV